ncbi:MAG: hypothetical protein ACFCGT_08770 [Sandaracinaceae bacterium]
MSLTSKTKTRRRIRRRKLGLKAKKLRARVGTPKFPLDPREAGPDSAEKRGDEDTADEASAA